MELKSKREASEILGVSTRGVERAVRRGQLSVQYRESKHGRKAWFRLTDLDRYKRHQQAREPLGFTSGIPGQPPAPGPHVGTLIPMVEIEPRHSKAHGHATVSIADRLALNVDEVVQLSGLPRTFIVQNIQSGKLHSIKIGRSQYVKRSDLNEFVESL
jgi:excisionase family DNA binding protein